MEYKSFFNKMLMKSLYKKADGFVFQTEEQKKYFDDKIQAKSIVIPNPLFKIQFLISISCDGIFVFIPSKSLPLLIHIESSKQSTLQDSTHTLYDESISIPSVDGDSISTVLIFTFLINIS